MPQRFRMILDLRPALTLCCVMQSTALAQAQFAVLDLGTVNGASTTGRAVNNAGQVAGFSIPQGSEKAFRTVANAPINPVTDGLGSLGGNYSQAHGMNDLGQVVGLSEVNNSVYRAFRTAPNGLITPAGDLGTLSGHISSNSVAIAINVNGQVAGWSDLSTGASTPIRAFRTGPNQPINPATDNLGTLGGDYSEARDINAAGQVTGRSRIGLTGITHTFRTGPNLAINPAQDDLGTLGGSASAGRAINDSGEVVGDSQIAGNIASRAFKTTGNGVIQPSSSLGTLGGRDSHALDINSSGKVVGYAHTADGVTHAFFHDGTSMHDLNGLIDPASGWVLIEAWSLNDNCQITGTGTLGQSPAKRVFLLTPISGNCELPDQCPEDPLKTVPGQCGCGVPDDDADNDGTADCIDACPNDPEKTAPGQCGCAVPDLDDDSDGVANCVDLCPETPPGTLIDEDGCPFGVAADFDRDSDVDPVDFEHFQSCATRTSVPIEAEACLDADLDRDGDADLDDFGIFQRCFSGSGVTAPLDCAG